MQIGGKSTWACVHACMDCTVVTGTTRAECGSQFPGVKESDLILWPTGVGGRGVYLELMCDCLFSRNTRNLKVHSCMYCIVLSATITCSFNSVHCTHTMRPDHSINAHDRIQCDTYIYRIQCDTYTCRIQCDTLYMYIKSRSLSGEANIAV